MIFLNMKFIKFHGIPWNSMELFWGKLKVPWNSMEFHGTRECGKSSMEFHGTLDLDKIPWNSMEFHGTTDVVQMLFKKFHGTLEKVPWNFLTKKFQWALKRDFEWYFVTYWVMLEMHIRYNANIDNKTYVGERDLQKVIRCLLTYGNQFIRHNWKPFSSKFWNSNSTQFYTILKLSALMIPMVPLNNKKRFHDTSSSMEFHGTSSAPISMTRAVPWNSMELGVRQFRWQKQFHGIPWNL